MRLIAVGLGLWAAAMASAAVVTVTGTLNGPGGDLLKGSCSWSASQAFRASDGSTVADGVESTVQFTAGALSLTLQPTTTGFPSTASYTLSCAAPSQKVTGSDGNSHTSSGSWGPWTLVVEPASSTLSDVLRHQAPPATLLVYLAAVSGTTTTVTAATHGLGTAPWVTGCASSSGAVFEPTVQVTDAGDVTITGTAAMTGTCRLAGRGADWVYVARMSGRSVTVHATTHGLVRPMLGGCFDADGTGYEPGGYFVNPASDQVTITASAESPEFTGFCILQ